MYSGVYIKEFVVYIRVQIKDTIDIEKKRRNEAVKSFLVFISKKNV